MNPTHFFKALADDTRLISILLIASEKELCVCELMVALSEVSQPKISRHLALLKKSGLLSSRKQKQWVYYSLSDTLPNWASVVINSTLKDNSKVITPHLTRLNQMGDRPSRLTDCCQ